MVRKKGEEGGKGEVGSKRNRVLRNLRYIGGGGKGRPRYILNEGGKEEGRRPSAACHWEGQTRASF